MTKHQLQNLDISTPSLVGRQCWGKTILPGAGYGLGTYRTVDIFNFSHFSWTILEKLRFLCFYIIKSMARKGYFGPKSDFRGSKIPPRGASLTWNMYYHMWDTCTSHFGPKKFDQVGRGGQGRSKYGPEMPPKGPYFDLDSLAPPVDPVDFLWFKMAGTGVPHIVLHVLCSTRTSGRGVF